MAGPSKTRDFPFDIERLFTSENADPFGRIHFRVPELAGDESSPALECPDNWSAEAAAIIAEEAACSTIPEHTRPIEENTVPSWLWRRAADGRMQGSETSVKKVFHRVAGAAAYAGWKHGVFADENAARAFFDETRYMLAQSMIALQPRHLAARGLDWAYGIEPKETQSVVPAASVSFEAGDFGKKNRTAADIRNSSIDVLLSGDTGIRQKWQKFLATGAKTGNLALHFSDVASDWNAGSSSPHIRGALNLLTFRREDGGIDLSRLRHAATLLTILLELLDEPVGGNRAIGFHNLAPLLMSQGLAYDSDAGRATAAALAAVITAEVYAASACIAGLLGPSMDFAANRESIMRALRNHRRAAYGDRNDYEKVSVLPTPLVLDPGADLALIAAARHRWDEVLDLVHQHGLRFARTDLAPAPALAFFMESAAEGAMPLRALTVAHADEDEVFRRELAPFAAEALVKIGLDASARKAVANHILGAQTLAHASGIDHAALRRHGFNNETLEKLENYLPYIDTIRLAFTPWILGESFCRDVLKIPAAKLRDPRFDLLRHLGFSGEQIKAANAFCYGHGTAAGAKALRSAQVRIFAQARDITAEARIRMAAAVQSFVSGDAGLDLELSAAATVEECEKLLLTAWRQGVRSVAIEFKDDGRLEKRPADVVARAAQSAGKHAPSYKSPPRSSLRSRPKASSQLAGIGRREGKSSTDTTGRSHGPKDRNPGGRRS